MPDRLSDWATHHLFWENRMTKTKLAKYKKRLQYWQRQFNLMDYEPPNVTSEEIPDDPNQSIISDIRWNHENRWVRIRINEDFDDTDAELNRMAFHEMCELRLGRLRDMACEEYSYEKVDEQIHIVIRSLENMVLNK